MNHLANESSPYLLQHATNPVDWYPWSQDALERAQDKNRPVFLSIGYSACHWCHVMAHESFENEEIARYLNDHFVSIKVDREERPDLDKIYQRAAQLMGVQGGWPLSVFMAPDQKPFWIGTYLPPDDRYGRPGFPRVLRGIVEAYQNRRSHIEEVGQRVVAALDDLDQPPKRATSALAAPRMGSNTVVAAASALEQYFDRRNGGFGTQPKFPNPTALNVFLRAAYREDKTQRDDDNARFRPLFLRALDRMATGGIYDHIGGGFHRYSTDDHWGVPHFEKMLYDNAQLMRLYVDGYQLAGDPRYLAVVRETANHVIREMTSDKGVFFSTQDADSEGQEGKFFVWTPAEFSAVLGFDDGELMADYFGVTPDGNFEGGTTVLHIAQTPERLAASRGLDVDTVRERITRARRRLFEVRERRIAPGTDDKILVSWNGLMIGALARAGLVTGQGRLVGAARRAADFLLKELYDPGNGRLTRAYRNGPSDVPGFLDDYAFLAEGLIQLYMATWVTEYLDRAIELTEKSIELFWDHEHGGFFYTPAGGESLVNRPRDPNDAAVPAAGSVTTHNLVMLSPFRADSYFADRATAMFELYGSQLDENPFAFASLVVAHDTHVHGPVEITVMAEAENPAELPADWQRVLHNVYVPDLLLAKPGALRVAKRLGKQPPIWENKERKGDRTTAYVCQNFACSPPVTKAADLERSLVEGPNVLVD